MAVEARHLNLFPSQFIQDIDSVIEPANQGMNADSAYDSQQMPFLGMPFAATLPDNNRFHQTTAFDSVKAKTSVNTDSGLTYNNNIPCSKKRPREPIITNQFYAMQNIHASQKNQSESQLPSFVGDDVLPQINQYQFEIDILIAQHTKKIKLELQERQKQLARMMVASIGEGMIKKLKEKDEQVQRMGKLNLVLQERVKSLYVENQLWRDLAQSNEAAANTLRNNLEQVLAHVGSSGKERASIAAAEDDAESCCGSTDHGKDRADRNSDSKEGGDRTGIMSYYGDRRCRRCGDREPCVLLLPCRHLCLCNVCGSGSHQLKACPVCDSSMTATLHVNMSD